MAHKFADRITHQTGITKKSPKLSLCALALMAISTLLLASCSGVGLKTSAQIQIENAESFIAANPGLSEQLKQNIRLARLNKGMSKREVIAAWGRPAIVRKYSRKGSEYWYFGCDWPHSCSYSDENSDFQLIDEIYESQAVFRGGKLIYWRF